MAEIESLVLGKILKNRSASVHGWNDTRITRLDVTRRYRNDGETLWEKMHWRRGIDLTTSKPVRLMLCLGASAEWQRTVHIHEFPVAMAHAFMVVRATADEISRVAAQPL